MDNIVSILIQKMAAESKTKSHEVILDCLEFYGLPATRYLTAEQIEKFLQKKEGMPDGYKRN